MKSPKTIIKKIEQIRKRYEKTEELIDEGYGAEAQENDAGWIEALSWVLGIKLKGLKE